MPDRFLAMNMGGGNEDKLDGVATIEPVFGIKAMWVSEKDKRKAEVEGFTVVDPSSVLVTHLSDILKKSAYMILEREGTQSLLDLIKDKNPTLVSELLPDLVSVGIIQRTLQNLLRERIPIKNLTLILETIADMAAITKNPDDLSEQTRKRLGMYFVKEYETEPNKLISMTLDPKLEQILVQRVKKSQFDVGLAMDPDLTQGLISEIVPKIEEMTDQGLSPCLVTTSDLRLALRRFLEPSYPQLSIFAYQEIPSETMVEPFASITLPQFSIPENFSPIPGEAIAGDTEGRPTSLNWSVSMITEDNDTGKETKPKRFRLVVRSAEEAVRMIRDKLGENARVVSVRQTGGEGLKRFISSPKLEVIAEVPLPDETSTVQAPEVSIGG